jgi:hypothetical protein
MVVFATPDRFETASTLTPLSPVSDSNWYVAVSTAFLERWTRSSGSTRAAFNGRFFFTDLTPHVRYDTVV